MKRFSLRAAAPAVQSRYATAEAFTALFRAEMSCMFHVAFLLTANLVSAEECFIAALDDCVRKDSVFLECAPAYARYAVIRRATKAISDRLQESPRSDTGQSETPTGPYKSDPLFLLPVFERAVFILCLLERFSDKQASLLLGATPEAVRRARIHGVERLGQRPLHVPEEKNCGSTPRCGQRTPSPEAGPVRHFPSRIALARSFK